MSSKPKFKVGDLVITDGYWGPNNDMSGKIGIITKVYFDSDCDDSWWYWVLFANGYREECKNVMSRITKLI